MVTMMVVTRLEICNLLSEYTETPHAIFAYYSHMKMYIYENVSATLFKEHQYKN
jgi:hypothetical protein